MKLEDLRALVKELIEEDLKNVRGHHEKTASGSLVLRKMHDAPGLLAALTKIDDPRELAHVIEALIDAVPMVKRADVLQALSLVSRHERTTLK